MKHQDLVFRLIEQVESATPKGKTELDVVTLITRPLWRMWCESVGIPADSEPSKEWCGTGTKRVYGSRTIVVDSDKLAAISFPSTTAQPSAAA